MTKIIVINTCIDCPHCRFFDSRRVTGYYVCSADRQKEKDITDIFRLDFTIPVWCPLESIEPLKTSDNVE